MTNPTQLDPHLNPGTQPKLGFIKYIIGLNPNLNPILGQPEFWVQNRFNQKKNGLGLAALIETVLPCDNFLFATV